MNNTFFPLILVDLLLRSILIYLFFENFWIFPDKNVEAENVWIFSTSNTIFQYNSKLRKKIQNQNFINSWPEYYSFFFFNEPQIEKLCILIESFMSKCSLLIQWQLPFTKCLMPLMQQFYTKSQWHLNDVLNNS